MPNGKANCQQVRHQELKKRIRQLFRFPKYDEDGNIRIPPRAALIWGPPGIGKSEIVRQMSREQAQKEDREYVAWNKVSLEKKLEIAKNPSKYYVFIDIRLHDKDPTDLRGLPNLMDTHEDIDHVVKWDKPLWVHTISQEDTSGCVLLDEIAQAPPSLQNTAHQFVLQRCIGETSINPEVAIIAASNREEDKANVVPMSKPLTNRWAMHVELLPPPVRDENTQDWTDWATENNIDNRIIAYLNSKPNHLFKFDPNTADKAWASPRTWEFCSNLIEDIEDRNRVQSLAASCIGQGTALEFTKWLKIKDSFDFQEMLKNPERVNNLEGTDKKFALISCIADYYRHNYKQEDFEKISELLKNLNPADYVIVALKFMKNEHPQSFQTKVLENIDDQAKFLQKYLKFLLQ